MIPENIEKLIGGYATGTLTEDERRQLFEAALDNQELFNVLHGEHDLKELLDDPVSRDLVYRAAAVPPSQPRIAWFRRGWIWASAVSAAVAVVLLIALVQWRETPRTAAVVAQVRPELSAAPAPAAPLPPKDENEPSHRALRKQKTERDQSGSLKPLTTPVPENQLSKDSSSLDQMSAPASAPAQRAVTGQLAETQAGHSQNQASTGQAQLSATQAQLSAGQAQLSGAQTIASPAAAAPPVAGFKPNEPQVSAVSEKGGSPETKQNLLRTAAPNSIFYTLSRKMPNDSYLDVPREGVFRAGEIIRLTIFSRFPGALSVWQSDTAHPTPKRIFPVSGSGNMDLHALENYTVPLNIIVAPGERIRVNVGKNSTEITLPQSNN